MVESGGPKNESQENVDYVNIAVDIKTGPGCIGSSDAAVHRSGASSSALAASVS